MKKIIILFISAFIVVNILYTPKAHANYGLFDGGMLLGPMEFCTCSGGMLILVQSYVDQMVKGYTFQFGASQLYANYNIMSAGSYFLTTLSPVGICLVIRESDCRNTEFPSMGMFLLVGTSLDEINKLAKIDINADKLKGSEKSWDWILQ